METTLKRIIIGAFAWLGGDSAKFTLNDLTKITLLNKTKIKKICEVLHDENVVIKHNNYYEVSKGGSKLINSSILYSIFQWNYESRFSHLKNYDTIQSYYLFSNRNLDILNIRGHYILDFCNKLITILNDADYSFDNIGYNRLRNYVIRLSLFPTKEFVVGTDEILSDVLYSQLKNGVISLSVSESYGLFIKFNNKKLRENFGRNKETH